MGSRRVRHNWATSLSLFTFHFRALEKEMATHSSVLAWRIPGTEETGGLPSMGSHRVRHNWSDLAAAAVANLYLTFCEPMHYSLPGSSVHGILPARILKWVAIFFPEDLPNPGIKPTSPTCKWILYSESHGNPKSLKKHDYGSKENWCGEIWLNFNYVNFILNGSLLPWFLKMFF